MTQVIALETYYEHPDWDDWTFTADISKMDIYVKIILITFIGMVTCRWTVRDTLRILKKMLRYIELK